MLGNDSITKDEINRWLDAHNLTKERLGLTSIILVGTDEPGILSDVAGWISNEKGNIRAIEQAALEDEYSLLIVVSDLNDQSEADLREKVMSDVRFTLSKVV